ncbi:zinc finger protein 69 homolog [Anopheles albimanus]|uniref:zinc finger protein 69 homolog n=1 Tax=Anopheles albimanus TaxID=7167 RepID=UPI0016415328|nr:zinc finger protein 69 homolog [Anopheles albimanus]
MLSNYCRICLTSIGVVHQLDEVVHKSLTLYAILCKMYPKAFSDENESNWPTRACRNCKQAVLDAYRLFTVCMATFEVLKVEVPNKSDESASLKAEINFPHQRFIVADSDVYTAEDIKIKSEEDDKSSLTSGEEELIRSTEERINVDEDVHSGASILCRSQQGNEEEGEGIIPYQIVKQSEIHNGATTYCNPEIVELSIEMDCVPPNNIASIIEEHVEDFEESMEYLDDIEDSLHTTPHEENEDNQSENPIVESTVAVEGVSDTVLDLEYLQDRSDESEHEEAFARIFATKLLSCESCQEVFLDKESHEKHIEKHSRGIHIFCKICREGFSSATALNSHKCKGDSSTLCWICGLLLDTREKHKRHMQDHVREGTWACQLCPARFSSESALKGHLRTHKKDKGHYCDVCGARLYSKRNLSYHQQAVHGGGVEKVYSCTLCDRRFSLPYMLKTHMNTHTGLRPYSCVYCNRVYGCGGDLVEHVAKHHVGNDNIYQCHLCDADFPKIKELKGHYEVHCRNGEQFFNEILTDFGKFRFTTMDLLKMRYQKEIAQLGNNTALNREGSGPKKTK